MEQEAEETATFGYSGWVRWERDKWDFASVATAAVIGAAMVWLMPNGSGIAGAVVLAIYVVIELIYRRDRGVLTVDEHGVRYDEGGKLGLVDAPWERVEAIHDDVYWRTTGPTLYLVPEEAAAVDDPAGRVSQSPHWSVPLMPFADRPFAGSALAARLERYIPEIMETYLAGAPRAGRERPRSATVASGVDLRQRASCFSSRSRRRSSPR